jgi:hypothetical protein
MCAAPLGLVSYLYTVPSTHVLGSIITPLRGLELSFGADLKLLK